MKNNGFTKEFFIDTKNIIKMIHKISKSFLPMMLFKNILSATLPFINIIFSYLILDALVLEKSKNQILNYVLYLVILNLVIGILYALFTKMTTVESNQIGIIMKAKIAEKALTLDYEQLENKENLELLHRAREGSISHGGISAYCNFLGTMIKHLISLIYSIILLSSLFKIVKVEDRSILYQIFNSPFSTIGLIILFIISLIVNFLILSKINKELYIFFERNVDGNRKFLYFLNVIRNYQKGKDIRIFDMADTIDEELQNINITITKQMRELSILNGKYNGLSSVNQQLLIFLNYAFVGVKALLGLISLGSVLKFASSLTIFNNSITGLVNNFTNLDILRKYLKNYVIFLELENKKYQGQLPIEKRDDNDYEIEFKNVSFHYPNSNDMILHNISIKLKVGNKMAIVGPNGAGKTTFIKLLCRLYDPTEGEILLNGINIKYYDYKEYLNIISVVFQDYRLFAFDIAQNIAANLNYDEQKVWEVLEQSGVKDSVERMKNKINTNIYQNDENGIEISGGEAQKIAIARALYKDAPLVILDEPTSALDPISEYEIYSKFDKLVKNKTSIYISHRMSSCRFCDNIVVFDKGQIVQNGSHQSLLKQTEGLYNKLWYAQAKYYNI